LVIRVVPGSLRLGNVSRPIKCLVRLYGVANNTWFGEAPLAMTPWLRDAITDVDAAASLSPGEALSTALIGVFALAGTMLGAWFLIDDVVEALSKAF
jgi:hypothetical protein